MSNKILPLKGLKPSKKYYLFFTKDEDDFIDFTSQNTYLHAKYKFVMITKEMTIQEIKDAYGWKYNKIAFNDDFLKEHSSYCKTIEFQYRIDHDLDLPDDLLPNSIRDLME